MRWEHLFIDLGIVIFHYKIELRKRLKVLGRYATMNAREGGVNCSFGVLKWGGMWLAKVARRGEISNAISKNFVGYCVGCEDL